MEQDGDPHAEQPAITKTKQVRKRDSMPVERQALTVNEAAESMGVSRNTVTRLVYTGQLGHVRIGKRIVIRPEAIREFLIANEAGGPAFSPIPANLFTGSSDATQKRNTRKSKFQVRRV